MATEKKRSDQYNDKKSYVVKDLIWKDHVSKIETAQRFYEKRWGYLSDADLQNSLYDPKRSSQSSQSNSLSPYDIGHQTNRAYSQNQGTATPSPRPIPSTSNRVIGWRTGDKNCTLEKYGKYARGQQSLHKKFKWPIEGFD